MGFRADAIRDIESPFGWSDTLFVSLHNALHRTDDGGTSWTPLGTVGMGSANLNDLLIPTGDPSQILVVGDRNVYGWNEGDGEWKGVNAGLVGQELNQVIATSNGQLWLATSSGVMLGLIGVEAAVAQETAHRLEALWHAEPTPAQVMFAALIYHGLNDLDVDGWHTRLRLSHLAPQVRGRLIYAQRRTDRETVTWQFGLERHEPAINFIDDQDLYADILHPELSWDVYATWDLAKALYDPAEINIERVVQQNRKTRQRLIGRIVRLLVKRRALQLRAAMSPNTSQKKAIMDALALEELTALLDGMTGGFYSTYVNTPRTQASAPSTTPVTSSTVAAQSDATSL